MFYWAVVQVVLIFGVETWFLLEATSRNLEGAHVVFFRQVTGHKAKRQRDGDWISVTAARVLKCAGTQTPETYIDKLQVTMAGWVALRLILDICNR